MDSLTQIVLGAACGEAVAGRKIGNRAMLWGAVGGTIPDLDVLANLFVDEISATSFHRGFMHSLLFACLAPWVLAHLTRWFYGEEIHRRRGFKAGAMTAWLLFYVGAAVGINMIPKALNGHFNWVTLSVTLGLGAWLLWRLWRDYWRSDLQEVQLPYRSWVALFFWSIFTHPLLDSFTSWGTQLLQPFHDLRVQWCTVSVVDPLATLPFALCLLVAARIDRRRGARTGWNVAGLLWFCGYLLLYTLWHKHTVNQAWQNTLRSRGISYHRYYTNPTIFNNIVWSGLAEGDTAYYFSLYGFNDAQPGFSSISTLPKHHERLSAVPPDTRAGYFLRWFTDGYFNVLPYRGDTLQVNDLRFGLLGDTLQDNNYVFPFLVFKNERGEWDIHQNNRDPKNLQQSKRSIGTLLDRVLGKAR
ncbi:MAG TPA: metal-dependent hydrolase [Saprospiraceae bacterium]|nr:metal-dependent hydrolase [Saprospiraceae bacterium]HNG89604.1 metal-dependent hydrolase [Saprospiraceae bacterium]